MDNGWIKLHRKILKNAIVTKPNYMAVWIYLLLRANHKEKEIIWNNRKTIIKAGSFVGSLRKISRFYGIGIATVKYIIDYLVSERMLEHKANSRFSIFTVRNWHRYQGIEHRVEHKVNTSRTQGETNKKDKNEKNEKNKNISVLYEEFKKHIKPTAKLTPEATKKMKSRLKEFPVEELKTAIKNFSADSWYMEKNGHRPMAWFFHSDERIETLRDLKPRKGGAGRGTYKSSNQPKKGKYDKFSQ